MKILLTGDWHIKLNSKNIPNDWSKNRYQILIDAVAAHYSSVDGMIVAGDIFDKLPSMDELEIFFNFISSIKVPTIVFSGNHESIKRNTTFLSNLKQVVNSINKNVKIIDDFYTWNGIDFIPYNKLKEKWPDTLNSRILASHCRGDIPPHVKAEIDLTLFDKWEVVLAGDLHSYSNSQRNILYPGSPVTTSFHRGLVDTGIIIFDTDTMQHKWIKLDVPQLIRKTIKAGEPIPATDYHHTIYEIFGDMSELSSVESSDLIDKKVVKRDTDTTLILASTMTLTEEVEEYLRYVLQLNEEAVSSVLKELSNHIGELTE